MLIRYLFLRGPSFIFEGLLDVLRGRAGARSDALGLTTGRESPLDPPTLESCVGNILRRCLYPVKHGISTSYEKPLFAALRIGEVIIIRFCRPESRIERLPTWLCS